MNTCIPKDLDASTWDAVESHFQELLERDVTTVAALEQWILDRSELEAACSEARANLYISMTCDTESKANVDAYMTFERDVVPKLRKIGFELDKRLVEHEKVCPLEAHRYEVLMRDTRADVEIFREENIPLATKCTELEQQYDSVTGAMMVEFDGEEKTLPQMAKYQESTDRDVRERAWRTVASRRLQDAERLDEIYDALIALRDEMARNAGFENYLGYNFEARHRFDYTPEDCREFHKAIEAVAVPFARRLDARRKSELGVDHLRPWDLSVDPRGRSPLTPFEGGADLVDKAVRTFDALDPRLASMLQRLGDGTNTKGASNGACLDLDSRKGKAPGGYQYNRDRSRIPFIFMNAAGVSRDVETMLHEAGHAFHSMLCENEDILHYRGAPIEFAEVASMTMELLTMPHWDVAFYPDESDRARAQRKQIEGSITMLPWIATIDAFQHWIYERPTHTPGERIAHWRELTTRFGADVEWNGLEAERDYTWQRQSHLYGVPLYYIEYGIAQLGALELWVRSLDDGPTAAIDDYVKGLSMGGSRPLPELFEAAGVAFDFSTDRLARLVERVETELEKLPE